MTALRLILSIVACILIAIGAAIALLLISPHLLDEVPTSWGLLAAYCLAIFLLNIIAGVAIGLLRRRTPRAARMTYLIIAIVFAIASPLVGAASVAIYECARGTCL